MPADRKRVSPVECLILEGEPSEAQVDIDAGGLVPKQEHLTPFRESHSVLDSGANVLACKGAQQAVEVYALCPQRCIDIVGEPTHTTSDDGYSANQHVPTNPTQAPLERADGRR